jgi:hypothetical protein
LRIDKFGLKPDQILLPDQAHRNALFMQARHFVREFQWSPRRPDRQIAALRY